MTDTPEPPPAEEPPSPSESEIPAPEPETSVPEADNAPEAPVDELLAVSQEGGAGFARGEALGALGANRVAQEARATVVVLLGNAGSGKTTLLAGLYERFGLGPLNGHLFLGSRTLHGFERRCFRSQYGDGPGGELDGHTAQDAPPWLHLRMARQEATEGIFEFLLGDFSGEFHSRPIADGSRAASDFKALRRADHVCVTVDGGAMARPDRRQAERRFILDLTKNLLADPAALADPSAISVIVTKWDLVNDRDDGRSAIEELFDRLREIVGREDVGYIETAARSSSSAFQIGFGLGDLLARWTDRPALQIAHPLPPMPTPADSFNAYLAPPSQPEAGQG
jgi:Double-GTPase 2